MRSPKAAILITLLLVFLASLLGAAIPTSERAALIALYNSTKGNSWTNKTGWKTPPLDTDGFAMPGTEGSWYGITAAGDHISRIELKSNNLSGSIPAALGNLTDLQYLDLFYNQLKGTIPASLGNLANLINLRLYDNQLSGSIPAELGNLANLRSLNLMNNQLSGSIPAELGNLTNLTDLNLSSNQLSGTIPAELANLTRLDQLYLSSNQLSGAIPTWIGNLTKMRYLSLNYNKFSGSIPVELGNLTELRELSLNYNKFSGSIPVELSNLTELQWLNLSFNQLNGSVPAELGRLINLTMLWLIGNKLSGTIPVELGRLINLTMLWLYENELSGIIPAELGNLANLQNLDLKNNRLSGTIPVELGNLAKLRSLKLNSNQLSGAIPAELGNLTNLVFLDLSNNQLRGAIPTGLSDLVNIAGPLYNYYYNLFIDYNALHSNDAALIAFLDAKCLNWAATQTIAPTGVSAAASTSNSFKVTWSPIAYTGNSGGYRIYYATSPGGPFTFYGQTANKSVSAMTVSGLTANVLHYFAIKTRTDAHGDQQNVIDSEYSTALPTVITTEITAITANNAVGGGNVTDNGRADILARGVCWSPVSNPTLVDSHTADGAGTGTFTSQIGDLNPVTTYYVRAYTTNSVGTVYGNEVNFKTVKKIVITLQGARKEVKAWLVTRSYGEIRMAVENPDATAVAAYTLLRRTDSGSWQTLKEIAPAELQNGRYTHADKYLDKAHGYTYQVKAVDGAGRVLAVSAEITI